MAPKTLILSPLCPFPLFHQFRNPNSNYLKFYPSKPLIIICKSTESQTQQNPQTEPEGFGAAAPTRGEIFLERQQSLAASTTVLAAIKKKKKKKTEKLNGYMKGSPVIPSCYGCGAPLQTMETDAPGYVDPDTYELVRNSFWVRLICLLATQKLKPLMFD